MKSSWIETPQKKLKTRFRLFCFPYAGGSALIFHNWSKSLPNSVEVCNIQLPGRDKGWKNTLYTDLQAIVEVLVHEMKSFLDVPYAFFGHSMGALICFELARQYRRQGIRGPEKIIVSAAQAPQDISKEKPIHSLPQQEFIDALRKYNGIPQEIIDNQATMKLFLPRLRADFQVLETYSYTKEPPLICPITAFGGSHDTIVSPTSLSRWANQTENKFTFHFFKGDHFFIQNAEGYVLKTIAFELQPYL